MNALLDWIVRHANALVVTSMAAFLFVICLVALLAPEQRCRESVADPGRPCYWRRQPTRLEIRGAVAICTCQPDGAVVRP